MQLHRVTLQLITQKHFVKMLLEINQYLIEFLQVDGEHLKT